MAFAEKLQELRSKNGLTQEQVADICSVSRQAVSKWESGLAYPETDKTLLLCDYFQISMDYLLRDGAVEEPQPQLQKVEASAYQAFVGKTVSILLNDKAYQGVYRATVATVTRHYLLFREKGKRGILRISDIKSISEAGIAGNGSTELDSDFAGNLMGEASPHRLWVGCRCNIRLKSNSLFASPQGYYRVTVVSATDEELVFVRKEKTTAVNLSEVLMIIES
ncbi:helix-turn-helix domain-containing protein [Gorillibacterium timonense]|uniref:helix-turn-helix domain-containing protein n=1 Tax=Gorillibacterium timonense TaxID=1689269 RepID=UPI00071C72A7|nr:helix-turn-helix domain-containing protein [Gorillibacterium timonense]